MGSSHCYVTFSTSTQLSVHLFQSLVVVLSIPYHSRTWGGHRGAVNLTGAILPDGTIYQERFLERLKVEDDKWYKKQQKKYARKRIRQIRKELREQIVELERSLRFVLEKIDPTLLLPSFEFQVNEWQEHTNPNSMSSLAEASARSNLLRLRGGTQDFSSQDENPEDDFIEIQQTMPLPLKQFVEKYEVKPDSIKKMTLCLDHTEFLLLLADISLDFSSVSAEKIYEAARSFLEPVFPADSKPSLEESLELLKKGEEIAEGMNKLFSVIEANFGEDGLSDDIMDFTTPESEALAESIDLGEPVDDDELELDE